MRTKPTTIVTQPEVLYMSLELSASQWKLAFTTSLCQKPRIRNVPAGQLKLLQAEIAAAKVRFKLDPSVPVISSYEAGRDGFWLHRCLVTMDVESHIVDPASIQVNRRRRNVKTDRIDAQKIVNALIRFKAGDKFACRMIRIPDKVHEDARHLSRELKSMKKERTAHVCRIKSLLVTQGCELAINRDFLKNLESTRGGDREPLGARLVGRLKREHERLVLVTEQIRELQKEQFALLGKARAEIAQTDPSYQDQLTKIAEHLVTLRGIGSVTAFTLSSEIFAWRDIGNRRQLAAFVGLTPTPHASGDVEKEQGISKSGRSDLRVLMVEVAWLWLQYQPESELSKWYTRRFANGTSKQRKIGIVALARKLLVALGKYVRFGEVPESAQLSEKISAQYLTSLKPKETRGNRRDQKQAPSIATAT
jgi:transposase